MYQYRDIQTPLFVCFFVISPIVDIPSFSDPDIPVVAREIMQRMIRQFAAEYTSKTSSAQGAPAQPNGTLDQSLLTTQTHTPAPAPASSPSPSPATPSPAGLAPARNPVLSQLLMAEQDAPLDLTVKKPDVIVCEQGVSGAEVVGGSGS